jgi:hypothetical protein
VDNGEQPIRYAHSGRLVTTTDGDDIVTRTTSATSCRPE